MGGQRPFLKDANSPVRGAHEKELRLSIQQAIRKWDLPTALWASTEVDSSAPAGPWDDESPYWQRDCRRETLTKKSDIQHRLTWDKTIMTYTDEDQRKVSKMLEDELKLGQNRLSFFKSLG